MSGSAGQNIFRLAFELSPIILVDGIASNIPGHMLPIIAITEAINFPLGLLSGPVNISEDNAFAHYSPLPGATMIDQDIGQYPFANQKVAANAVITKPLAISMQMIVPAKGTLGYFAKLPIMMLLQDRLAAHNASGGLYTILTPSTIYFNCVMRGMRDTSTALTKQVQNTWQLDFQQPLTTLEQAQSAQGALSNLMKGFTDGSQITAPAPSSILAGTTAPTVSQAIAPVAQSSAAAGVGGGGFVSPGGP